MKDVQLFKKKPDASSLKFIEIIKGMLPRFVYSSLNSFVTLLNKFILCNSAATSKISDVSASHLFFGASSKRAKRMHDFNTKHLTFTANVSQAS